MSTKNRVQIRNSRNSGYEDGNYGYNPYAIWVTEFEDQDLVEFYDKFMALENNPNIGIIPIFISSYGGSAYNVVSMIDLIKSCEKPVATVCVGKAFSAGALLLAAGTKGFRFMTKHSQVMLHQVSSGSHGKTSDIESDIKNISYLNSIVLRNLAGDMGIDFEKGLKQIMRDNDNADLYLNSEKCLSLGIVDAIDIPRIILQPGNVFLGLDAPPPAPTPTPEPTPEPITPAPKKQTKKPAKKSKKVKK